MRPTFFVNSTMKLKQKSQLLVQRQGEVERLHNETANLTAQKREDDALPRAAKEQIEVIAGKRKLQEVAV